MPYITAGFRLLNLLLTHSMLGGQEPGPSVKSESDEAAGQDRAIRSIHVTRSASVVSIIFILHFSAGQRPADSAECCRASAGFVQATE